jgi:hypothetical protein
MNTTHETKGFLALALSNVNETEARAVWDALAQFIENSEELEPEEMVQYCGKDSPAILDAARALQARLDAAMIRHAG